MPATVVIGGVFAASVAVAVVLVIASDGSHARARGSSARSSAQVQASAAPSVSDARSPEAADVAPTVPPNASEQPTLPPRAASDPCATDMVLVSGSACPYVAHKCARKRKEVGRDRGICEAFENEVLCEGRAQRVEVCMDRFEYPNRSGALPAVLLSFDDAERVCASHDKRLCTVREWQFACEGESIVPLPMGLSRDPDGCTWDRGPVLEVVPSLGPDVAASLQRSDRRARSGSAASCKSVFGVFDLTGNVREWVRDPEHGRLSPPFTSALAGGAWGSGAATCRTLDQDLPPPSRSASAGFRCCQDVRGDEAGEDARKDAPESSPRRRGFRPIVAQ